MKATGIVRKVDDLGRVVIPMEIRRTLDIAERDSVEIFIENDRIVLRKYEPACIFCGEVTAMHFKGKMVCEACKIELVG